MGMVVPLDILPGNATALERALSLALDPAPIIDPVADIVPGLKIVAPPPSFLPYLVYEYGLGELTPYLPNLYQLIDEGVRWQRVRGTPSAIDRALGWLGYAGQLEEPPMRRARWTLFQWALDRVRDAEADLPRIEGVVQLSVPTRSVFFRGFAGYDIRATEADWTRLDGSILDDDSGVRLAPERGGGSVKWSFGDTIEIEHALTVDELEALGVYEPPVEDRQLGWDAIAWPAAPWTSDAVAARQADMLSRVAIGTAWVSFKAADGSLIGHRRAKVQAPCNPAATGPYRFGAQAFAFPAASPRFLLVEALTDFGDGADHIAASVGVQLDGVPVTAKPGTLYLPGDGLAATGPMLAETPISVRFDTTVRHRIRFLLRFDGTDTPPPPDPGSLSPSVTAAILAFGGA